jgi:phosphomannomutase
MPPHQNLKPLRDLVQRHKADFGVCFGGDASTCTFVDERGGMVRPDRLAVLLARALIGRHPGATVVVDHRFGRVFTDETQRAGGTTVLARGDLAAIKKAISERNAVFGADLEGRFFFRENFFCESAIIALVQVLNLLAETDRRLSDLLRPLGRYASSGELRFPCEAPQQALQDVAAAHQEAQVETFDGLTVRQAEWWFNARPAADRSSVLLIVEARNKKVLAEKLAQLRAILGVPRGRGV